MDRARSSSGSVRCWPPASSPRCSRGACGCPASCSCSCSAWRSGPTARAGSTSVTSRSPRPPGSRARADPLRGRPLVRLGRDPAGDRRLGRAGDARHAAHGRDHGGRGRAAGPRTAGSAADGLHGGGHRRRRGLRRPARIDAAAAPGADARGRVRRQRPGRDPARDRVHRGDPARRLRDLDALWLAIQSSRSARRMVLRSGPRRGVLRRVTLPSAGLYPVASMALGGARVRRRGRCTVGLARRVHRRPGHRQRLLSSAAHDRDVPRRARVGRPARAVPDLGLLVFPSELVEFIPEGAAIAIVTA